MKFHDNLALFFPATGNTDTALIDGIGDVLGILEKEYLRAGPGSGVQVPDVAFVTANPACAVDNVRGASCVINDVRYVVADAEPEKSGLIALILELV